MTTPAINRSVIGVTAMYRTSWSDTVPPYTSYLGDTNSSWDEETRPQSSNGGRANGFRLCHPWSHSGRKWQVTGGHAHSHLIAGTHGDQDWPGVSFWGGGNTFNPPSPGSPSQNLINSTEVKALNKLKSQDFHLGNFLAESRQTIGMVAGNARRIAKQVHNFRRTSPAGWSAVKQFQRGNLPRSKWPCIPSAWLELQYGWIPLMSDINGALHHLARRARFGDIPVVVVKSTGKSSSLIKSGPISGKAFSAVYKNEYEVNHRVKVTLAYGMADPQLAELSSLGLINPLEIVWEVIPYSFVVDWFLPIGGWLSALTADVGYSFISGTKSIKSEMKFKGSRDLSYNAPGYVVTISPSGMSGFTRNYSRTCYSGSPVPGLYVKNPLSTLHLANALALLAQAFRG